MRVSGSSNDGVVDALIRIVAEDDPTPMVNFRRTQKIPNGADRFKEQNERPELNLNHSKNLLQGVHRHNRAYPCLEDELKKKASITQVATIKPHELNHRINTRCEGCAQLATYEKLKRLNPKPKCKSKSKLRRKCTSKTTLHSKCCSSCNTVREREHQVKYNRFHRGHSKNCKRITKTRPRKSRSKKTHLSILKFSKVWLNKSCQCSKKDIIENKSTNWSPYSSNSIVVQKQKSRSKEEDESKECKDKQNKTKAEHSDDEENGCRRFRSIHPSMSSINSFGSMAHEPMDL